MRAVYSYMMLVVVMNDGVARVLGGQCWGDAPG